MASPAPAVHTYLDYRRFLSDWFAWRKAESPRFSHRAFMRRAGLSSPSLLLSIIEKKRNLTPTTLEGFVVALRLPNDEAAFFRDLVELDQASSLDDRNRAWDKIAATRRFREARLLEGAAVDYLSSWYVPAVRELAACEGFRADPEWIAATLQPRIKPAEARRALELLRTLGLLRPQGDSLVPVEASVVTPHEVAGLAAMNYHIGMLERASEALTAVPSAHRHYCAVTVAVREDLLPRLKAELDRFQERLLDLCDSAEGARHRVVQLNLQLFPLSREVAS